MTNEPNTTAEWDYPPLLDRDALIDIIAQGLHGTYHCNRVWEAWNYGTMGEGDFSPVDESDTPAEITDSILAHLAASPTAQAAPAAGAVPAGIYVASRASLPERPARWRALRTAGWPIVSTWIDEAGPGETDDAGELWARILREVASAQGVVLHVEPDDFPLKGALVEVGMALSLGKRVGVYAPGVALEGRSMRPLGSWAAHPLVRITPTLQGARDWIEAAPQPPAQAQEPVKRVYLVATGEEHEGEATYTRYDDAPPPLCDAECLFSHSAPRQAVPTSEQAGDEEALRERDEAEEFIDALLDEVLGSDRPEWSNVYGRTEALQDVQERITALHAPAVDQAWERFQATVRAPASGGAAPACPGVPDPRCNYLASCGRACNKCGKVHRPELFKAPVAEGDARPPGFIKPDTDAHVFFYEQDFYVLSNFSSFTLDWKGIRFDTSEAAYHWEKFVGKPAVMTAIQHAPSAHEAFKVAEHYKPFRRADWDAVKVNIMRTILTAKAEQHEYVRRKLLATGSRVLVEDSWRDDFWGWGPNRDGQNMLGKLWMEVRDELRAAARAQAAKEGGE